MFLRVISATLFLCGVAMAAGSRPVCPGPAAFGTAPAIPMWPLTKTGILRRSVRQPVMARCSSSCSGINGIGRSKISRQAGGCIV